MPILSVGDLASTYQIRRLSTSLKADLTRLGVELTEGRKSDIAQALGGDVRPALGIERSLTRLDAYDTTSSELAAQLTAAQFSLESVQEMGHDLTPALLSVSTSQDETMLRAVSTDAVQKFETAVSRFNTEYAGRALFSGVATDKSALAEATTMLDAVRAEIAAETTAEGIATAVASWFHDPGGGFETMGYLGADSEAAPYPVAENEFVSVDLRANQAAPRKMLAAFALASLLSADALAGQPDQQAALASIAADWSLTAENALTDLRASVGAAQQATEDAQVRNGAERTAYSLARAELVAADPYEAATELEAVYGQIETLYTVTARIATLKFSDYM